MCAFVHHPISHFKSNLSSLISQEGFPLPTSPIAWVCNRSRICVLQRTYVSHRKHTRICKWNPAIQPSSCNSSINSCSPKLKLTPTSKLSNSYLLRFFLYFFFVVILDFLLSFLLPFAFQVFLLFKLIRLLFFVFFCICRRVQSLLGGVKARPGKNDFWSLLVRVRRKRLGWWVRWKLLLTLWREVLLLRFGLLEASRA